MSPKRRTLWGTPGVRISAGRQHIAYRLSVKHDFAQFLQNLPRFEPAVSGAERVKEKIHQSWNFLA
jgi:hypothetical protein